MLQAVYDEAVRGALPSMRLLAVAGLAVAFGSGCTSPARRDSNRLNVGMRFEYTTPNELIGPATLSYNAINGQFFLPLMEERPDFRDAPPTWAPGLASGWEFSEDRRQLTVRLRPDVLWSDGRPVTAEDVRFTWRAQTDPDVAWNYSFSKESITDVEAVDAGTVRFHFDTALASVLDDVSTGRILPRHAWETRPLAEWRSDPGWFFEHLVTNGPFLLEDRTPGQELVLGRNRNYFATGFPRLDRVVLRAAADGAALANRLLSGELDVVSGLGATEAQRLEGQPGVVVTAYANRQFTFVSWNTRRPWFRDAATRRALAMAIDRQAIVDTIWHGYAEVGNSPIISSVWAHDPEIEPWPHDPGAARDALTEAGWEDGDGDGILERDGKPFRFELATFAGAAARWNAMQMIQADLRAVGIDARPRRVEANVLIQRMRGKNFDAAASSFAIDTGLDLRYAFHSREIPGGHNYAAYADSEVDRLLDAFAARLDPMTGLGDLHRLQRILHEDQPMLVLWEPLSLAAFDEDVESVAPNVLSPLANLKEWAWR